MLLKKYTRRFLLLFSEGKVTNMKVENSLGEEILREKEVCGIWGDSNGGNRGLAFIFPR